MEKTFTTKMSYKAWGIIFIFFSSLLLTLAVTTFTESSIENILLMGVLGLAGLVYGLNHFLTKIKVTNTQFSYTTWYRPKATLLSDITRIVEASKMPRMYASRREMVLSRAEARAGSPAAGTTYFLDVYTGQHAISIKDIRHFEGYEELYSMLENATGKKVERNFQQWREQVNPPGRSI